MSITRKLFKLVLSVWGMFAIAVGCILPIIIAMTWWTTSVKEENWRSKTSPLPLEIVRDICSKFDSSSTHIECISQTNIYAPDLFPIIKEAFLSSKSSSYEDVQLMLAQYQVDFEPPVTLGNGDQYFVSWYDLRGDSVTSIVFFFH